MYDNINSELYPRKHTNRIQTDQSSDSPASSPHKNYHRLSTDRKQCETSELELEHKFMSDVLLLLNEKKRKS